jgi:hypothetical protein
MRCNGGIIRGMVDDPDEMIRYPLNWARWLDGLAKEAAKAQMMPLSVYIRLAVQERLERDGYKKEGGRG